MHKQYSSLILAAFVAVNLCAVSAYGQDTGDSANTTATEPATTTANEHVAHAVFTSAVQNRKPTDTITSLSNDHNKIYFYSELIGLGGQSVTHRWEYQGKTMAEVKFNVGGPRWRVWSSKTLLPQWTGEWRVSVIDGNGNKVGEATFNYTEADKSSK